MTNLIWFTSLCLAAVWERKQIDKNEGVGKSFNLTIVSRNMKNFTINEILKPNLPANNDTGSNLDEIFLHLS